MHTHSERGMREMIWGIALGALLSSATHAGGLQDFSGTPQSLDDYSGDGRWLVVMIWASDCHICNNEAASYVRFHEQQRGGRATVLGISMDGPAGQADAEAFITRHRVSFPNLIGDPGEVAALYSELTGRRWIGTPSFLVYAPDGSLSAQQVGAVPVELIERHMAGR